MFSGHFLHITSPLRLRILGPTKGGQFLCFGESQLKILMHSFRSVIMKMRVQISLPGRWFGVLCWQEGVSWGRRWMRTLLWVKGSGETWRGRAGWPPPHLHICKLNSAKTDHLCLLSLEVSLLYHNTENFLTSLTFLPYYPWLPSLSQPDSLGNLLLTKSSWGFESTTWQKSRERPLYILVIW